MSIERTVRRALAALAVVVSAASLAGGAAGARSAVEIIRIPLAPSGAPREPVTPDAHLSILEGGHPTVADRVVMHSGDGRLVVDVAEYDRTSFQLKDWPVDELMLVLDGQIEISGRAKDTVVFGPGRILMMPRGFSGTWRQRGPIRKVAVSYVPAATAAAAASAEVLAVDPGNLNAESALETVEDWGAHLKALGPRGKYRQRRIYHSSDGRFEVFVKYFTSQSLQLGNWPIEEWMYLAGGHVQIRSATQTLNFGPGDTFVIPKNFSGDWLQKDNVTMVTAQYDEAAGNTLHGR